jgi:CHAD domain-containing protein
MRNPAVARALSIARRAEVARLRRRLQATSPWRVLRDGPTLAGLGLDPDLGREDLERTIRRQWRRIERLLEAQPATPEARHALRIKLKNLRYALEAIEDPHDKRVIGLVASLRHAQDLLGADRDVEFACGWLEQAGLSPTVARAALRHLQRRSRVLAARRPALLRELRRAVHRWYGTTG